MFSSAFTPSITVIAVALCAYLLSRSISDIKVSIAERAHEDLLHSTALEYVRAVSRAEQWLRPYSELKHVGGLSGVHAFDVVDDRLGRAFSEEGSAIEHRDGLGLISRDTDVQRRITYNLAAMNFESTEFNQHDSDFLKKLAERCYEADAKDRHLLTWWRHYHKNYDGWVNSSIEERMNMLRDGDI